jgi:hypothetical protein
MLKDKNLVDGGILCQALQRSQEPGARMNKQNGSGQ